MKRLIGIALALVVLAGVGLALLARYVFTGPNVRAAIEAQVSAALGQPVTIGGLGASVYPRVTMDLTDVTIGKPARIQLAAVHVGTGLRALISRRIEHADIRVDGASLTLPLPSLGASGPPAPTAGEGKPPVEIVSIDEIVLRDVEVISGGRRLRGDIELVPHGAGVQIRRMELAADVTAIRVTGDLTSLAPMTGTVNLAAESLDIDHLVDFVNAFTAASVAPPATRRRPRLPAAPPSPVGRLTVGLKIGKATTGTLALSDFTATAVVTPDAVRFEPLGVRRLRRPLRGQHAAGAGRRPGLRVAGQGDRRRRGGADGLRRIARHHRREAPRHPRAPGPGAADGTGAADGGGAGPHRHHRRHDRRPSAGAHDRHRHVRPRRRAEQRRRRRRRRRARRAPSGSRASAPRCGSRTA